ncbi:MAG: hypothetical protein HY000_20110, partial [Planctomycetes bacterium]|nr:hypothetical protein [Planctomycetota bacterium]
MMSTLIIIAIVAAIISTPFVQAWCMHWTARRARVESPSYLRALLASIGGLVTPVIVLLLVDGATRERPLTPSKAWHPAAIALAVVVSCWTVKRCLRATILFRLPGQPEKLQALRIVGRPGETIFIRDAAVWVDGVGLNPSDDLVQLEYSTLNSAGLATWGTSEEPAVLGADEFFVLGDFSAVADDSRTWLPGAPGRRAYAL